MIEVSAAIRERSRKIESTILHSLADRSQVRVAELLGTSETTISLMKKDGRIEQMAGFIAALGLVLVSEESVVYDAAYISALQTLAVAGIKHPPTP